MITAGIFALLSSSSCFIFSVFASSFSFISLFQRVVQPTLLLALLRLTLLARGLLHAATLRLRNLLVRRRTQHNGFLLLRLWLLMLVLALLVEQQTALAMMLHADSNRHGIARDRLLVQLR